MTAQKLLGADGPGPDPLQGDSMQKEVTIVTRCPSCGCQTLFIGSGGHLTCALIGCLMPSVADKIAELQRKAHRYDSAVIAMGLQHADGPV